MTLIATILAALTASAIATTDATPHEQRLLERIAFMESGGYDVEVYACRRKGRIGEVSAFQVLARNDGERRALCASLEAAAAIALARLRESMRACPGAKGAEQLCIYVSGRCGVGMVEARQRWVE